MNFQRRPRQQRASEVGVPLVAKAKVPHARLSAWKNNRNDRPLVVPQQCWPSGREVPILAYVLRRELEACRAVSSDAFQQRVSDLHELRRWLYGSGLPPGWPNRRRRQALHHLRLTPDRDCAPRPGVVRGESGSGRSEGAAEKAHRRQNGPKTRQQEVRNQVAS